MAGGCGGDAGGIAALSDEIDAHRGAFEHDWRARFHMPLREIGRSMTWGEALRLTEVLAHDPSSMVCAAIAGWEHPFSWEAIILADVFDVQLAQASQKRPKPWPRPWLKRERRNLGRGTSMSIEQLEAVLAAART